MTPSPTYKILIPTAGVGPNLGGITEFTNKALIKVGKKPTLSYIIEAHPKGTPFVITIGHYGDQVRDFVRLAYPDLDVTFIEIDTYQGKGSSLAYSMLKAQEVLQCPFIYQAGDTIVLDAVPPPTENWIAGYRGEGSSQYSSFDVVDGQVQQVYDKGTLTPDFLHIGLVGIKDYQIFWKELTDLYAKHRENEGLGDIHAIKRMVDGDTPFIVHEVHKWYDVGNVDSLNRVRAEIPDSFQVLDKLEEGIFLFDSFVVKFFHNEKHVQQRVARGKLLGSLVPAIEATAKNFYRYRYVPGKLFSSIANPHNFRTFLEWAEQKLWKEVREVSKKEFTDVCLDFFQTKTIERIQKFLQTRGVDDATTNINEEVVPPVMEILKQVDFGWLARAKQSQFHGDLVLDNIIQTENGFCLLDWRQNFGGLLKAGDRYYDFAKLNHNLTVNHAIINKNQFTINIHGETVSCDILRRENLVECQRALFDFLAKHDYDAKKVRVLTAIIWLNMSPLHHHPFDLFLFYFGKLNLWRALQKYEAAPSPRNT